MKLLLALVPIVLIVCCTSLSAQDRVTTNDNRVYTGKIVEETDEKIVIQDAGGTVITLPRGIVAMVEYGVVEAAEPASENKAVWRRGQRSGGSGSRYKFPYLGFTFGTPAAFNVMYGDWLTEAFGFRFSGLMIDELVGGQFDLKFRFSKSRSANHSLALVLGGIDISDENAWYLGAAYAANWSGFYLSIGAANYSGSDADIFPVLQLGYVYEFR